MKILFILIIKYIQIKSDIIRVYHKIGMVITMNVSDYIVKYLENLGIKHFFGYQGTMIAYFAEAVYLNPNVQNHSCYNEQGAAFAACGYAKASGSLAVAYATSGPGALNLISGIADAYYDSAPVLFITGQLNTSEYTDISDLRQQGFQQTDVINIVKPVVKYATMLISAEKIAYELEKACYIATSGRKGPVLLDIPMNIQKMKICEDGLEHFSPFHKNLVSDRYCDAADIILSFLQKSKHPVFLLGNGISKNEEEREVINKLVNKYKIPVLTSILGKDLIEESSPYNIGFIGSAYGHRSANIIIYEKTDLIISLGCSLCRRQTGGNTERFAQNAKIIRVDIDDIELKRKIHEDEISLNCDVTQVIRELVKRKCECDFSDWLCICQRIKSLTADFDSLCPTRLPNQYIYAISKILPNHSVIVSDVGQHQMWIAQSFGAKKGNRILFSGGHGAMGFALSAAIGAYYATGLKPVCIAGDGAFQMNIQELQWVFREKIPIIIFIFNNHVLGLIRQQQDDFFHGNYFGSSAEGGYSAPSFVNIAKAYEINSRQINSLEELYAVSDILSSVRQPLLLEIMLPETSRAHPKTYFGEEMNNQRPYIPAELLKQIKEM